MAPISREFVHMDGLVVPLAEKLLVACLDTLEPWLVDQLKEFVFSLVDVLYSEPKFKALIWLHWEMIKFFQCRVQKHLINKYLHWALKYMTRICQCAPLVVVACTVCVNHYVAKNA